MATAIAYALEARRVHEQGNMTDTLIARATGAAASTVRGWLNERAQPSGERAERLLELAAIVDRLTRLMEREYIPVWLSKPIEVLEDEKPIELIRNGEYRRVAALVSDLEYPAVS